MENGNTEIEKPCGYCSGTGDAVDTHGHSPWHFTAQASLDLNPGDLAISHIQ